MLISLLFGSNLTPEEAVIYFLITIFVFLFSLTMHEFAHGMVAYKMGDTTAKAQGRLTLNPFKHLDLKGTLCFLLIGVGWAKPIPINPMNFKEYRKGIRRVSIAGVATNFTIGFISALIYLILNRAVGFTNLVMQYIGLILIYLMIVNSFLVMFNILPLYPLDGFNFVTSFMRADNKFIRFNLKNGMMILWGIILVSFIIEMISGIDVFGYYLSLIDTLIFSPIAFI